MLDKYLAILGVPRQQCYITNALMCYTKHDRPPLHSEVKKCSVLKYFEFRTVDVPKVILLLGYDAHQLLFDYREHSITSVFGDIYSCELYGKQTYLVPVHHPGAVLMDMEMRKDVATMLMYVRQHLLKIPLEG